MAKTDLEELAAAKPVIRTALAFLAFMRLGEMEGNPMEALKPYYNIADGFLDQLEKDLKAARDIEWLKEPAR